MLAGMACGQHAMAVESMVPPTQKPSTLICGASQISCTVLMALSTPSSM
jgi:hypothetical protein